MKIGGAEIIIILIILTALFIGIRLMGAGSVPKRDESPERYRYEMEQQRRYDEQIKASRRSKIQILGLVAIVAGLALFAYSSVILGLLKWAFWGPVGAVALVVVGVFVIFAARRR